MIQGKLQDMFHSMTPFSSLLEQFLRRDLPMVEHYESEFVTSLLHWGHLSFILTPKMFNNDDI